MGWLVVSVTGVTATWVGMTTEPGVVQHWPLEQSKVHMPAWHWPVHLLDGPDAVLALATVVPAQRGEEVTPMALGSLEGNRHHMGGGGITVRVFKDTLD
jgi:hypothetical protein